MSSRSRHTDDTLVTDSNENDTHEKSSTDEHNRARVKEFGQLFNRRSSINRALLEELFRKEPSEYTQTVYRYASRIYHCLKEDQINPVLKALSATKEEPTQAKKATLDVPKIDYASDKQKRRTLKLSFSVLRYQKIVEELLEETQFFSHYPELKDELSLVSTVLYDYLSRKFQPRDDPIDIDDKEDLSNDDPLILHIEDAIIQERTHLAAALARNRIKSQALSLEDLLPENVREVQQHSAELHVYAWVNLIKTDMETVIKIFEDDEQMRRVKSITDMDKRAFCIDYHCPNLLVFHYSQKQRIANHYLVRDNHLYLQDKSSCIAAHTVRKLITRKDNICITYVSGGLLLQLLLVLADELESKIYAFGARTDENIRDIQTKIKTLGASEKRVKIFKERFNDVNFDEVNIENCKVILCNPPDSRSALIQPLEFLYNEGEDVSLLKQFSQPTENKGHIRECIQRETAYMRHAVRYTTAKAIVYVTFSKNRSENEDIVHSIVDEQNEQRSYQKKEIGSYKISPPVLPIQFGPRNEQTSILRHGTFIQFDSSQKMNGVFVAVLLRERERRRSVGVKKKTDDRDSDSDTQQKSKKEHQGFQFETEARAAQRRQQGQKVHRKSVATASNRRSKSSAAAARDVANTSLTQNESKLIQQTQPVRSEPKPMTLSERLASIGRITGHLDTTDDDTPIANELENRSYQQSSIHNVNVRPQITTISMLELMNKINYRVNDDRSNLNKQQIPITRQCSDQKSLVEHYRNIHSLANLSIKQCKITFESSEDVIQRCRICKFSYRRVCRHVYDIDYFRQMINKMNRV